MINFEKIFEEVEKLSRDKVMDIMTKLIGVDTTVPPGNTYRKYVDLISPYFRDMGYELKEVVMPEELVKQIPYPLEGQRVNLVATKDYGQKSYVCFYGHMDVVPAPNDGEKKWKFPPFEATLTKAGKIFGRGTSDMKGAMVCLILALEIIDKLKLTPKYNIRVMNCTDEEIGTYPGVRYLEEQGYVKDIVFCMEGVIIPIIAVGAAGAVNIVVETIGRSCHSGSNFMGINALEEMVPIMVELLKLKKVVEKRESVDIPGIRPSDSGERMKMSPMFNLDIIHSGEKENIVPDLCTLIINRRYIPDENYEDVIQEIKGAVNRGKALSKALDVKITIKKDYPAFKNDANSPANLRIKKVMSLVQGVSENEIPVIGSSGSTDMGFLTDYDVLIHGNSSVVSNSHGVNEVIKFKDILTYIKEIIVFLCADL